MFELTLYLGVAIIILAFLAEYVDSTLGMGYGTSLTPIFLIMGFDPLQIVPAVLVSELITGFLAGFMHHYVGNADFRPRTMNPFRIFSAIKKFGFSESFKRGVPLHLKLVLLLAFCSIIGTVSSVFLAISLPKFYLKLYIGILVILIGLVILLTLKKNFGFSWKKVIFLGLIASFNKGISGGGYGPVVTGGQLLAGVNGRNAIAITSLAEGITCVVGILMYFFLGTVIDWVLLPYLVIGAVLSVPLSALTVKKITIYKIKISIGVLTLILGIYTIWQLF